MIQKGVSYTLACPLIFTKSKISIDILSLMWYNKIRVLSNIFMPLQV